MALGYEQITVSNAVLTVSSMTVPAGTLRVELQAEGQQIRYTMDGSTDPAVGSGMVLLVDDEPTDFLIEDVTSIRMIRGAGSDATLDVHYFGAN